MHSHIRKMKQGDCKKLASQFCFPWSSYEKELEKWEGYYKEQLTNKRLVFILEENELPIGYESLLTESKYPFFAHEKIPEISDLRIDNDKRGNGYGTALIAYLENIAKSLAFQRIGIGVGLYKDYGTAQKLYCQLGYIPDSNGITYKRENIIPGNSYPVDDDLILWLVKPFN